jgi:hypothetical protein
MTKIRRMISSEDVLALECTIDNQMHILRHFESTPQFYYDKILNCEFQEWNPKLRIYQPAVATSDLIEQYFLTLGSKFDSVRNPHLTPISVFHEVKLKLLAILAFQLINPQVPVDFNLFFDSSEPEGPESLIALLPDMIEGYCSLISYDQMTLAEKNSVYKGNRGSFADKFEVNVLERNTYLETSDVVIQVKKPDYFTTPKLISCYNGILTPPYPNIDFQSEEDYDTSIEFWNRHAFIKLSK